MRHNHTTTSSWKRRSPCILETGCCCRIHTAHRCMDKKNYPLPPSSSPNHGVDSTPTRLPSLSTTIHNHASSTNLRAILDRLHPIPAIPISTIMSAIKDLCIYVQSASLLPAEIAHIWSIVHPLVSADDQSSVVLELITTLIHTQYDTITEVAGMRTALFKAIHSAFQPASVKALGELTKNGTDLAELEFTLGAALHEWLSAGDAQTSNGSETIQAVLALAAKTISSNLLPPQQCDGIASSAAVLCSKPQYTALCLSLIEVMGEKRQLPNTVLPHIIRVLCDTVNFGAHSEKSWNILKMLLESPRGRRCMVLLCNTLEQVKSPIAVRGAVFTIAMSTWGTYRVKDSFYSKAYFLACFARVVATMQNDMVDGEILRSIERLVKKYGVLPSPSADSLGSKGGVVKVDTFTKNEVNEKSRTDSSSVSSGSVSDIRGLELTVMEWEAVICILKTLSRLWHEASALQTSLHVSRSRVGDTLEPVVPPSSDGTTSNQAQAYDRLGTLHTLLQVYQTIMNGITDVYQKLTGSSSTLYYDLLYQLAPHLSQPLANSLLDHLALSLWQIDIEEQINVLSHASLIFYVNEARPAIRRKYVLILDGVLGTMQDAERDEMFERVFVPIVPVLGKEADKDVFLSILGLILNVVAELGEDQGLFLVAILLDSALGNLIPKGGVAHEVSKTTEIGTKDTKDSMKDLKDTTSQISNQPQPSATSPTKPLQSLALEALMHLFEIGLLNALPIISTTAFSAILKIAGLARVDVHSRITALRFLLKVRADSRYRIRLPSSDALKMDSTNSDDKPIAESSKAGGDVKVNSNATVDVTLVNDGKPVDRSTEDIRSIELEEARKLWTRKDTITSPQVVCFMESAVVERTGVKLLPIDLYASMILDIFMTEKSYEVYTLLLNYLPAQMENIHLWAGAYRTLADIRKHLCVAILDEKVATSVIDIPSTTRKADLYASLYKILLALIPHRRLFTVRDVQDEVVMAFHAGLNRGPTNARLCLQALTLCLYELPSSMTRLLPETKLAPGILDRLSRMPSQALILEFLSSLARLPDLYVNFTERDFRRVFGMAVQYVTSAAASSPASSSSTTGQATQTSIMTQYVLNMAYHVVTVWFTALKVVDRRRYVPFIVHYFMLPLQQQLNVNNKTIQLDENAEMILDMMIQNTYSDCSPKPPESSKTMNAPGVSRSWIMGNALTTIKSSPGGWFDITIRRASGCVAFSVRLDNRFRYNVDTESNPKRRSSLNLQQTNSSALDCSSTSFGETAEPTMDDINDPQKRFRHRRWGSMDGSTTAIGAKGLNRTRSIHGRSNTTSSLPTPSSASNLSGSMDGMIVRSADTLEETPASRSRSSSASSDMPAEDSLPRRLSNRLGGGSSSTMTIDPAFFMAQVLPYPDMVAHDVPRLLPDDEMAARYMSVLDLTPVIDLHKLGVVYVGPGQKKEAEILANTHGSRAYGFFLRSLGSMIRLKGIRDVNTGGLDTKEDFDGTHAVYWQDDCAQVIFHAATLMPTRSNDERSTAKKRHIGNDSIVLVWNESGDDYQFDTLPGQFNHVNIVIAPLDPDNPLSVVGGALEDDVDRSTGLSSSGTIPASYRNACFRVVMQRRPDIPDIGPISEAKLVSGASLAKFVRQIAVHANIAVQIFFGSAGGGNVKERLRQLRRIRQKYAGDGGITSGSVSGGSGNSGGSVATGQTSTSSGISNAMTSDGRMDVSEAMLTFTRYL
ncbi:hypothetical protein SeMB42_g04464 [Synchytrium endobioticum]|uniref:Rap-GAP domain-containing protein n=1 Tax=Synchytrium endobioticum TaxID=286115 RepID=A0A507CLL9_9FUNG|nr:hypothetical protein SeLEV6574_g07095 [Synchytrium endobioticum]TPX44045.1 hypothetical protein SeMB42_g04464 [Synchytrium endobioticum]